uniref:Uncharacterized protein n=1 Tax=Solanum lycopersicum TaxID=4081 RepID=A0A3Q7GUH8_SOLLC
GSTMYGFRGGQDGVMKGKYMSGFDMICSGRDKIRTPEQIDLDGLVVIVGDDSNTNACLLAENIRSKNFKYWVIGCPKTIDVDFKSQICSYKFCL